MPLALILMAAMTVNVFLVSWEMVSIAQVSYAIYFVLSRYNYVYVVSFPDIDECAYSALNNCNDNANCTDTIGCYECTCSLGYSGDGFLCDGMLSNPFL